MDEWWGHVKSAFGGIQGGISYTPETGVTGSLAVGERRVMSVTALAVALVFGILIGYAMRGGR